MFATATPWLGIGLIGIIIWVAIAFSPAPVAGRKGHSFIGYFLLSLLFLPLSLLLAYLADDRTITRVVDVIDHPTVHERAARPSGAPKHDTTMEDLRWV